MISELLIVLAEMELFDHVKWLPFITKLITTSEK
jgi:hypothetical protein